MFYTQIEICPNCKEEREFTYRKITTAVKVHDICKKCLEAKASKEDLILKDKERNDRLSVLLTLKKISVNYSHLYDEQTGIPTLLNNQELNKLLKLYMQDLAKRKKGFYLYGKSGSGKTTLMQLFAYQLLLKPAKKGLIEFRECLFMTEANIVSRIFQSAKEDFDWNFPLAVTHFLKHKRFIFIDEIGAKNMKEKELEIVDLLFHFFEENKSNMFLFATSNKSMSELGQFYSTDSDGHYSRDTDASSRIISRLYGLVIPHEYSREDLRKKN